MFYYTETMSNRTLRDIISFIYCMHANPHFPPVNVSKIKLLDHFLIQRLLLLANSQANSILLFGLLDVRIYISVCNKYKCITSMYGHVLN